MKCCRASAASIRDRLGCQRWRWTNRRATVDWRHSENTTPALPITFSGGLIFKTLTYGYLQAIEEQDEDKAPFNLVVLKVQGKQWVAFN